ncbi:hypothetical protein MTO96_050390 [Rhipicephalus appendiculatus]
MKKSPGRGRPGDWSRGESGGLNRKAELWRRVLGGKDKDCERVEDATAAQGKSFAPRAELHALNTGPIRIGQADDPLQPCFPASKKLRQGTICPNGSQNIIAASTPFMAMSTPTSRWNSTVGES